jgi:hypothetical protein
VTVEQSLAFADSLHLDGLKVTVGLRIYPGTALHSIAVAEGVVRADDDLLSPRFYLTAGLQDWLPERTAEYNAPALRFIQRDSRASQAFRKRAAQGLHGKSVSARPSRWPR